VVVIPISHALEWLSVLALRSNSYATLIQTAYAKQWQEMTRLFQVPGGLALAIFLVGVLAPIAEEVFFRGFVYRCFRARWGPTVGIAASAALFAGSITVITASTPAASASSSGAKESRWRSRAWR